MKSVQFVLAFAAIVLMVSMKVGADSSVINSSRDSAVQISNDSVELIGLSDKVSNVTLGSVASIFDGGSTFIIKGIAYSQTGALIVLDQSEKASTVSGKIGEKIEDSLTAGSTASKVYSAKVIASTGAAIDVVMDQSGKLVHVIVDETGKVFTCSYNTSTRVLEKSQEIGQAAFKFSAKAGQKVGNYLMDAAGNLWENSKTGYNGLATFSKAGFLYVKAAATIAVGNVYNLSLKGSEKTSDVGQNVGETIIEIYTLARDASGRLVSASLEKSELLLKGSAEALKEVKAYLLMASQYSAQGVVCVLQASANGSVIVMRTVAETGVTASQAGSRSGKVIATFSGETIKKFIHSHIAQ